MSLTLVADIGGTNARFAHVDHAGVHDVMVLKVADYDGPAAAARFYLESKALGQPSNATFAIAGPVTGADRVTLTNHPWNFSIAQTKA